MQTPLVSIITPTYNSEKFIFQTIQSVQNQTYINWELLIVDDASQDTTVSIINPFVKADTRIQLFQFEKNTGTGAARNFAVSKAKGKYIAFLDSDDLWKPNKLAQQLHFLIENHLPFTFSFYECIDEKGSPIKKRVEAPKNLTYNQLFFCNYIGNLTGIYDTKFFGKIEISNIRKRQDWMLWLVILKKVKKANPVPESLALYRIRTNSISASKLDLLKHNFAVYNQFHGFNKVVSVICMIGFLFTQLAVKPFYIKKLKK